MASCIASPTKTRTNTHTLDDKIHTGEKFLKWTDQDNSLSPVTVSVDLEAFYICLVDQRLDTTILDLSQVQDVRTGSEARIPKDSKLREQIFRGPDSSEQNIITIVYGNDFTNINYLSLLAVKVETAKFWASHLEKYVRNQKPLNVTAYDSLRKIHQQILLSVREDRNIPSKNIMKTFASSREDRKLVEKALEQAGLPHGKNDDILRTDFQFNNFQNLYLSLCQRKEIMKVFNHICAKTDVLKETHVINVEQFLDFLNNTQRDSRLNEILHPYYTKEKAANLITKYEPSRELSNAGNMSVEGFIWYLVSEDNNIISQDKLEKMEDMEYSLAHYYIKSSHNTYLTGHQITGKSSLEMYRQVLLSGCRCIELDFWNGPKEEDEPVITHGYTLVTNLLAKDVLQVISVYAFKASDYPLILSFENHCNPKQQAKIAKYCEEFFGDMMLQDPLPEFPLAREVNLPSPRQLQNKILIKNKKQHHYVHKQTSLNNSNSRTPSTPSTPSHHELPVTPSHRAVLNNNNNNNNYSDSSDCDVSDSEDESESSERVSTEIATSDAGTAGAESSACAEISALVNYIQPVHFRSFEHAEKRRRAYEMSSFVETTALSLLKNDPVDFVKYNKFQLSRVYPKGTRVDSSNFLPQIYWNAGCQLVALNYQTLDTAMQINLGIFQFNQGYGYLLKPEVLRRDDRIFDPFTQSSVDNIVPATLSLQILSGQFLTDKHVGTYVEVEMYGLPCDTVRREKKFKTKTVQSGMNPIFSEEPFIFRQIILPDLAVVRIAAYEEGSRLIGHRVLPVTGLNPGYRHIPLFNVAGQPLHLPCLFVNISVKDYVPNRLNVYAEALANPIKYQQDILAERTKALEALEDDEGPPDLAKEETDSTSECSSPSKSTIENINRKTSAKIIAGSSGVANHPNANTDSPTPAHRAVTNKMSHQGSEERKGSVTLLRKDLTPETIIEILEHRSVVEKQHELKVKVESLHKKKRKDQMKLEQAMTTALDKINKTPCKTKNPLQKNALNKIVKKFSTAGLDSSYTTIAQSLGTQDQLIENLNRVHENNMATLEQKYLKEEFELKERYVETVFEVAEKCMTKSHAEQIKSLSGLYTKESNEVLKKIDSEDKSQNDRHDDGNASKDELRRERRERLVKKGVQEKGKLKEMYTGRKQELEQAQERRKEELKEEKERQEQELKKLYSMRNQEIKEMYGKVNVLLEEEDAIQKVEGASTRL